MEPVCCVCECDFGWDFWMSDDDNLVNLNTCNCAYMQGCLKSMLNVAITNNKLPIKCPGCTKELSAIDINAYVSKETMAKYYNFCQQRL